MQRHLPPFKSWADTASGPGFLPFVPTAGGLTLAGALPTTKTLTAMLGSRIRFQFVKIHSILRFEILARFGLS